MKISNTKGKSKIRVEKVKAKDRVNSLLLLAVLFIKFTSNYFNSVDFTYVKMFYQKNRSVIIISLAILLSAISFVIYFKLIDNNNKKTLVKVPVINQNNLETKKILTDLKSIMDLPINEEPSIWEVSDKSKLQNDPFFIIAKNGDIVIAYNQAQKVILYRSKDKKIINVTSLATTQKDKIDSDKNPVRIAIYNGTRNSELVDKAIHILSSRYVNLNIVTVQNARMSSNKDTLVIDLAQSSMSKAASEQLSKSLNGKMSELPNGESKPDADVLVILGEN